MNITFNQIKHEYTWDADVACLDEYNLEILNGENAPPFQHYFMNYIKAFGKTLPDDEPIKPSQIAEKFNTDAALWSFKFIEGYDSFVFSFGIWCFEQIQHLAPAMVDREFIGQIKQKLLRGVYDLNEFKEDYTNMLLKSGNKKARRKIEESFTDIEIEAHSILTGLFFSDNHVYSTVWGTMNRVVDLISAVNNEEDTGDAYEDTGSLLELRDGVHVGFRLKLIEFLQKLESGEIRFCF